ncbi:MAG: IS110 family transposase [Gammaproteobacteria bacterium]
MNEAAVGIDVSKLKLDVCVAVGAKFKYKVVKNTRSGHAELIAWLLQRHLSPDVPVVLEATGPYSEAAATALADAGWRVSVVNPARVKGFAQSQLSRNKTDKADAKLLATFAQRADLELWQPPSPAVRELHALVDRLQALQDMHQQECNRLEALSQSTLQGKQSRVVAMVQEHIDWLNTQIAEIESEIHDHIDGNPDLKHDADLIRSIPGCGPKLAAQFLAYVGDVRRFKSAKALAAFVGVTPRQKQSGSSVNGRTTISRAGHARARKALYMPGLVAKRYNPVVMAMAKRLESRGLAPKAIVGASMHKLVHLIYGVIKSGTYFDMQIPMRSLAFQDGI